MEELLLSANDKLSERRRSIDKYRLEMTVLSKDVPMMNEEQEKKE